MRTYYKYHNKTLINNMILEIYLKPTLKQFMYALKTTHAMHICIKLSTPSFLLVTYKEFRYNPHP